MAKLEWKPRNVERMAQRNMMLNMNKAVLFAEGAAKKMVSRGNRGGGNPSGPYEPPKVVTGTLRSNIAGEVIVERDLVIGVLGVKKGPANDYAKRLELGFVGTDNLGRKIDQKPRPFLKPTLSKNERKLKQILGVK
jgi:hypothetical protein